jgi:hypothetical protein
MPWIQTLQSEQSLTFWWLLSVVGAPPPPPAPRCLAWRSSGWVLVAVAPHFSHSSLAVLNHLHPTCTQGFGATPIPTSVTQSSIWLHHSTRHRPSPLQHNTKIPLSIKTNAKNYTKLQFHVLPSDTGPTSSIPTHKPNRYQHKGQFQQLKLTNCYDPPN